MNVLQCVACNGVYMHKQPDGTAYFHVCPPSVAPANQRNENLPTLLTADALKIIAAGLGTQIPAVIPPGMSIAVGV